MTPNFEITRETPKALQIFDGEATFWIQRRWMREDGTLTPAGEKVRIAAVDAKAERDHPVEMPIAWENDRSIGIDYRADFTLSSSINARAKRVRAFISKKMVEVDRDGVATIPAWLEKKVRAEALKKADLHHGYSITGGWAE